MTTLADLERALAAASPGPWVVCNVTRAEKSNRRDVGIQSLDFENAVSDLVMSNGRRLDAEFIALARNALPSLLKALRAAEELVKHHDPRTCRAKNLGSKTCEWCDVVLSLAELGSAGGEP